MSASTCWETLHVLIVFKALALMLTTSAGILNLDITVVSWASAVSSCTVSSTLTSDGLGGSLPISLPRRKIVSFVKSCREGGIYFGARDAEAASAALTALAFLVASFVRLLRSSLEGVQLKGSVAAKCFPSWRTCSRHGWQN